SERAVPRERQRVQLRDELVAVEQGELEVGMLVVEAPPVAGPGLVVVQISRKRARREGLEADRAQVGPVGVADELHRRSSSATACAASPSPRPVNPSRSVVVALT